MKIVLTYDPRWGYDTGIFRMKPFFQAVGVNNKDTH